MKLEGFGIFVKDMPTMVRFYRDVLGFGIKEDENTTNVFLEKDGTLFLLYGRNDIEKMTNSKFNYAKKISGHFEIALGVENYAAVDKTFAEVKNKAPIEALAASPLTADWLFDKMRSIADEMHASLLFEL